MSDGKTSRPLVASATSPDVARATTRAAEGSPAPLGITRDTLFSETYFTQVPNHWLRNPDLSYRTKGILAAIASHRAGYRLTMAQLINDSKDGRDSVRAGVKEAELAGYLVLTALRDDRGRHQGYAIRLVEDPAGEGPQRPTRPGRDQGKQGEPAGQNRSGFTAAAAPQRAATPIEEHSKKTMLLEDQEKKIISLGSEPNLTTREAPNRERETIMISSSKDLEPADILDGEIVEDLDPATAAALPALRAAAPDITDREAAELLAEVRGEGKIRSIAAWLRSDAARQDIPDRLDRRRSSAVMWADLYQSLGNTAAQPCTCVNGWVGRDPATMAPRPCHRCKPHMIPDGGCTRADCTHCQPAETTGAWDV